MDSSSTDSKSVMMRARTFSGEDSRRKNIVNDDPSPGSEESSSPISSIRRVDIHKLDHFISPKQRSKHPRQEKATIAQRSPKIAEKRKKVGKITRTSHKEELKKKEPPPLALTSTSQSVSPMLVPRSPMPPFLFQSSMPSLTSSPPPMMGSPTVSSSPSPELSRQTLRTHAEVTYSEGDGTFKPNGSLFDIMGQTAISFKDDKNKKTHKRLDESHDSHDNSEIDQQMDSFLPLDGILLYFLQFSQQSTKISRFFLTYRRFVESQSVLSTLATIFFKEESQP